MGLNLVRCILADEIKRWLVAVDDVYDHVIEADDKKGHQIFGQEESAPPETILDTPILSKR